MPASIKDGRIKSDGSPRDISNIYTDDLFSKHKEKIIDSSNVEAPNETLDLMSGSADKFNTRQGYRKEEHYWGDGGARIIDFLIRANNQNYPPVIKSNSITDFCFKVIFDEEFEDVTAGILIKTHDGLNIYGSNSFYADEENQHISAKKGSIKIFKFKTSLELNAGHYLVSFGVSTGPQEMLKPLNRRYDSVLITLDREKPLLGIVDLRSEFEMIL